MFLMLLEYMAGAVILLLGIMYLRQITSWSPRSFRLGLVIRTYTVSFFRKIPEEIIKTEIVCTHIHFKFNSPTKGLFRAYPKSRGILGHSRKTYLPTILGEINIRSNGVAEINWRIPLSLMLIGFLIFLILVGSNLDGGYSLYAILSSIAKSLFVTTIFVLSFIILGYEKNGFGRWNKRVKREIR